MAFRLAPSAETAGYRLEAHESVGSTNALALDHARAGDPGNLWVVASRQESGRGRRGRRRRRGRLALRRDDRRQVAITLQTYEEVLDRVR